MEQTLVLQDVEGKVVRTFNWSGNPVQVVRRQDTRRLELVEDISDLEDQEIPFENLGSVTQEELSQRPLIVGSLGRLSFVDTVKSTHLDLQNPVEGKKAWRLTWLVLGILFGGALIGMQFVPLSTAKIEEELKQQVVRIVKNITKPDPVKVQPTGTVTENTPKHVPTKTVSIKRMGALSALGSLKTGKQKAGLDLGAAQTSAGPGLGGSAGSGGIQTSIYAKGLVSAPLGAGGNVNGAGGYGTKGKGGGQAGYGSLSLVGSSGASSLPLGAEATVAKGLDHDQIAAVINRNLGQVRFCYEQALQSDPTIKGRVTMGFTIGGNGLIKAAEVENSSLNSKSAEECIVLRLKTWKFPLPEGGVDVKVSYPFVLRRAGQG
jgi:hypothetical protein